MLKGEGTQWKVILWTVFSSELAAADWWGDAGGGGAGDGEKEDDAHGGELSWPLHPRVHTGASGNIDPEVKFHISSSSVTEASHAMTHIPSEHTMGIININLLWNFLLVRDT